MKTVTIQRSFYSDKATLGVMIIEGEEAPIFTLENPWLDNKPYKSCIPVGVYECRPHNSPKFGEVYIVENVEGRTHILFHAGNRAKDTYGCILLGSTMGYDNEPFIGASKAALKRFKTIIGDEAFKLIILLGRNHVIQQNSVARKT